eukprot:1515410-Amphidinium_carterae.1
MRHGLAFFYFIRHPVSTKVQPLCDSMQEQKLEIRIHMTALHYLRGWYAVHVADPWCPAWHGATEFITDQWLAYKS